MKKRWFLFGLILTVLAVYVAGVIYHSADDRKKTGEDNVDDVDIYMETETDALSSVEEENDILTEESEDEFLAQIESDSEFIGENGQYFRQGDYVSYGGFGYQVLDFRVFDSYQSLTENIKDYDSDEEFITLRDCYKDYIYLTLRITNEGQGRKQYYVLDPSLKATVNRAFWWEDNDKIYTTQTSLFYVSGFDKNDEDQKNSINPILESGESMTLYLAYGCFCVIGDLSNSDYVYINTAQLDTPVEWYYAVSGSMKTSDDLLKSLDEIDSKIFFKLDPGGENE